MKLVPMERLTTQTLLGIQFWDSAIDRPVSDGLKVKAQRLSDDRSFRLGRSVVGRATPSGVIAFFGLASEERVEDDPKKQIWDMVPPTRLIAIDLEDTQRRYLPMSFVAQMPHRGAFKGTGDWLKTPLLRPIPKVGDEKGVYLWSAPSRSVVSTLAVIRAQIALGNGENPPTAKYALVEAIPSIQVVGSPKSYFGLTDSQGTLLLPFSYPPPQPAGNFNYPSLDKQTFKLTITVRYESKDRSQLPGSDVLNLETILQQKPANIITQLNPLKSANSMLVDLKFGRTYILQTMKTDKKPDSYLRIKPK